MISSAGQRCTNGTRSHVPPAAFRKVFLIVSSASHTISVSTAPMSDALSVSLIPKQYLPVSSAISSKYFWMSRFSWTNLTFASESAASSMAWS